jgi:NAD kinase
MSTARPPRLVLVTRPTEYDLLIRRHATRGQAAFFLETRGQSIIDVERKHERFGEILNGVLQSVPTEWRRSNVTRADLDRFLFEPDDIVVALGQDGLVANVAKYLRGQPVIGLNPDPETYDGVLVRHAPAQAKRLLLATRFGRVAVEERTMVEACLDDTQKILALNEVFIGHRSHQSARYRIRFSGTDERQSSSGLIVATGTGATGWARSMCEQRRKKPHLPAPTAGQLAFLVREPFPSVSTGTKIAEGVVDRDDAVEVVSEMDDGGVVFGDGIEDDRVMFPWGVRVAVRVAETKLRLVQAA